MKRLPFIAVLFIGLVSCAKVEQEYRTDPGPVSFVARNYKLVTRIQGPEFPIDESFGAYGWVSDGSMFMDDETVSYQKDSTWKPSKTYFWKSGQTVDFFCYYPVGLQGLKVTQDSICFRGIDVHALQQDILYSDKSVGYTSDVSKIDRPALSGKEGVPALFRHALAKVQVKVELLYNHKTEPDGTTTDWKVKIGKVKLSGIRKRGDCVLLFPENSGPGPVKWLRPVDEEGYHVWTDDGTDVSVSNDLSSREFLPGDSVTAIGEFYVLPQTLVPGRQQVSLELSILTFRDGVQRFDEKLTLATDLYQESLPAWQMNQSITYRLKISPTASNGNGGGPANPDLSDVLITFDPAADSWQTVNFDADVYL